MNGSWTCKYKQIQTAGDLTCRMILAYKHIKAIVLIYFVCFSVRNVYSYNLFITEENVILYLSKQY